MTDDLLQADSFRLGTAPSDEEVDRANFLIDRISAELAETKAKLKMVLDREAESQRRHDKRMEAAEAKLAKAAGILKFQVRVIESSITPNETGNARLLLNGEYHTGPVVDWVHATLEKMLEINTTILAELGEGDDDT